MDDFRTGADLCDEFRLLDQARLLRAMAGDAGKLYLVAEREAEYNDSWYDLVDGDGEFRNVFLDRASAQTAADLSNARKFREFHPVEYGGPGEMSSLGLPELDLRIGRILGTPCELYPAADSKYPPPFPEWATDEQMIPIAALFDKLRFFHVIEAEFGG